MLPTDPELARWFAEPAPPHEAASRGPRFAIAPDESRDRAAAATFPTAKNDAVRAFDDAPDAAGASSRRPATHLLAAANAPSCTPAPIRPPAPS